jgi:iron complex outermembrane recepter protein
MLRHPRHRLMLGVAAIAVSHPAISLAQTQSAQTQAAAQEAGIEDIVVTAQKRSQNINDVGLTVTALGGDALAKRNIASLEDIANSVPSLTYTNTSDGTPVYTLRGVGFYETSIGAYPTTSVYLDEVPLSFSVLTRHSAFDLQRLEVLKGPQGTLFGQNATGGAINYIANKPTDHFSAGANLTYGRFNEVDFEGYVSGRLSETLTARLSGRVERSGGWQVSNTRPDDRLGRMRNYMGRLLVDFRPSDRARFTLNVNGWIDRSEPQAPQLIAQFPQAPAFANPSVIAQPFSPLRNRAADWTPGLPFRDNSFWQASLRGDIDLTDTVTLTTISAYTDYKQRQGDEQDGLPVSSLDQPHDDGLIHSFSQEVRLANGGHSAFRWVVGGNYEKSRADQIIQNYFPQSTSHGFAESIGYHNSTSTFSALQKMENYAGFANGEYDLTSRLTVKAGVRYTEARRRAVECNTEFTGVRNELGDFFYDILLGGRYGSFAPGKCFSINLTSAPIGGVAPGAPGQFNDKLNEHNVSWRGGVDFKAARGLLLYANVSKGYKAGSYPIVGSANLFQNLPVVQESVLAYEAGFKATLLNRALQLNGAAFYYDYHDKQLRSKFVDPVFGVLDVLQNVPRSSIKGFEIEVTASPFRGLTASGAFTYLDAKIDRFIGADVNGNTNNFAGTPIPFTPKYQIGANIDYERPFTTSMKGFAGVGFTYRSSTSAAITLGNPNNSYGSVPNFFAIDAYKLVDIRAGVADIDDRWRASVFVKNLFNEYYFNNAQTAADTIARFTGRPRTWGVSLAYKF